MRRAQAGSITVVEVVQYLVHQLLVLQDQWSKHLLKIKDDLVTLLIELSDKSSCQHDNCQKIGLWKMCHAVALSLPQADLLGQPGRGKVALPYAAYSSETSVNPRWRSWLHSTVDRKKMLVLMSFYMLSIIAGALGRAVLRPLCFYQLGIML
jgi:hypothetical protein